MTEAWRPRVGERVRIRRTGRHGLVVEVWPMTDTDAPCVVEVDPPGEGEEAYVWKRALFSRAELERLA